MTNCEKCVKADVCKYYEPKSAVACEYYETTGTEGKWDWNVGMNINRERYCNVCKKLINTNNIWNYCPNCGAKNEVSKVVC